MQYCRHCHSPPLDIRIIIHGEHTLHVGLEVVKCSGLHHAINRVGHTYHARNGRLELFLTHPWSCCRSHSWAYPCVYTEVTEVYTLRKSNVIAHLFAWRESETLSLSPVVEQLCLLRQERLQYRPAARKRDKTPGTRTRKIAITRIIASSRSRIPTCDSAPTAGGMSGLNSDRRAEFCAWETASSFDDAFAKSQALE